MGLDPEDFMGFVYGAQHVNRLEPEMAAEHIVHAGMHACTCTHEYVNRGTRQAK